MSDLTASGIRKTLKSLASPEVAKSAMRFFKTGPGEYGEGDQFHGIKVPVLRKLSKEYKSLPLTEVEILLQSPMHEERHLALMILVLQVAKAKSEVRDSIYEFYLNNTRSINNWDLVDCSAPHIVGVQLFDKSRKPLHQLVKSKSLWERRIAIISTQHFIKQSDFGETILLAEKLMADDEDLIHKASGWMLREIGERDIDVLKSFLTQHAGVMPRTMLRYAIEHLEPHERQHFLGIKKRG